MYEKFRVMKKCEIREKYVYAKNTCFIVSNAYENEDLLVWFFFPILMWCDVSAGFLFLFKMTQYKLNVSNF